MIDQTRVMLEVMCARVIDDAQTTLFPELTGPPSAARDMHYLSYYFKAMPSVEVIVEDGMRKLLKLVPARGRTFPKHEVLQRVTRTAHQRAGTTAKARDAIWLAFVNVLYNARLYRAMRREWPNVVFRVDAKRYELTYTRDGLHIVRLPAEKVATESQTAPT